MLVAGNLAAFLSGISRLRFRSDAARVPRLIEESLAPQSVLRADIFFGRSHSVAPVRARGGFEDNFRCVLYALNAHAMREIG
jgi:hypothetical protein